MGQLHLKNASIVGPHPSSAESCVISIDRLIDSISVTCLESHEDRSCDMESTSLFPGFIDVHNHGAVGVDVNSATAEELMRVAVFLAGQGVTSWMPTIVPDSDDNYRRIIIEIDRVMELQIGKPIAQVLGVHYEGVFANEAMCGALRPKYFKTFSGAELDQLPRLKQGIHMTTFAPEVAGGIALAGELTRQGWIASIGHTRADTSMLDAAFAAGARHMTHFFNAMTGVHHRDIGVAGWGLANPDVTFDIIADGIHVDPRMLGVACRAKSPSMVTLISDSVAPTGLGDGEFELWGETIAVQNGKTRNERGSIAGSVSTMLDGVRMLLSIGFSNCEVAQMASANPAKLLGIDATNGSIEVGKSADLVALDDQGNVRITIVRGQILDK